MSNSSYIKLFDKVFHLLKTNDGILSLSDLKTLYKKVAKSSPISLNSVLKYFPQIFELDDDNYVSLKTDLRICKDYITTSGCSQTKCNSLHICKFYICKTCTFKDSDCQFGHNPNSYNQNILDKNNVGFLRTEELFYLLKRNDPIFTPLPCKFYNNSKCSKDTKCPFLHICQFYLKNQCQFNMKCKRSHNIFENQPKSILIKYGVDIARSPKDVLTQLRIALSKLEKSESHDQVVSESSQSYQLTANSELCLYYIQGNCKYGHSCRFIHVKTPYAWFYFSPLSNAWFLFDKQDVLELYYCDPARKECYYQFCLKTESEDGISYVILIDFENWSIRCSADIKNRPTKACRISTPSFGISSDKLATHWVWYWQFDDLSWKEYGKKVEDCVAELTSHNIEKLYCNFKKSGKLEFTTNLASYYLCFDNLHQVNTSTNKVRKVCRRPRDFSQDLKHPKSPEKVKDVFFCPSRNLSALRLNNDSESDDESD